MPVHKPWPSKRPNQLLKNIAGNLSVYVNFIIILKKCYLTNSNVLHIINLFRDTQTVQQRHQVQQTTNAMSTQMTKIGVYVSNMEDKLMAPGRYTTAADHQKRRLENVRIIICNFFSICANCKIILCAFNWKLCSSLFR